MSIEELERLNDKYYELGLSQTPPFGFNIRDTMETLNYCIKKQIADIEKDVYWYSENIERCLYVGYEGMYFVYTMFSILNKNFNKQADRFPMVNEKDYLLGYLDDCAIRFNGDIVGNYMYYVSNSHTKNKETVTKSFKIILTK